MFSMKIIWIHCALHISKSYRQRGVWGIVKKRPPDDNIGHQCRVKRAPLERENRYKEGCGVWACVSWSTQDKVLHIHTHTIYTYRSLIHYQNILSLSVHLTIFVLSLTVLKYSLSGIFLTESTFPRRKCLMIQLKVIQNQTEKTDFFHEIESNLWVLRSVICWNISSLIISNTLYTSEKLIIVVDNNNNTQ